MLQRKQMDITVRGKSTDGNMEAERMQKDISH